MRLKSSLQRMMPIQAKDDADSVGDMFSRHVPFFHFGLGFGEIHRHLSCMFGLDLCASGLSVC